MTPADAIEHARADAERVFREGFWKRVDRDSAAPHWVWTGRVQGGPTFQRCDVRALACHLSGIAVDSSAKLAASCELAGCINPEHVREITNV